MISDSNLGRNGNSKTHTGSMWHYGRAHVELPSVPNWKWSGVIQRVSWSMEPIFLVYHTRAFAWANYMPNFVNGQFLTKRLTNGRHGVWWNCDTFLCHCRTLVSPKSAWSCFWLGNWKRQENNRGSYHTNGFPTLVPDLQQAGPTWWAFSSQVAMKRQSPIGTCTTLESWSLNWNSCQRHSFVWNCTFSQNPVHQLRKDTLRRWT